MNPQIPSKVSPIALWHRLRTRAERLEWLPSLLARLSLFAVLGLSGWGKLTRLERTTGFFQSLGLPAPGFQAALVGTTELVCGSLLLVGLATRQGS